MLTRPPFIKTKEFAKPKFWVFTSRVACARASVVWEQGNSPEQCYTASGTVIGTTPQIHMTVPSQTWGLWTLSWMLIRWEKKVLAQIENICILQPCQEAFSNHWARHRRMYKYVCPASWRILSYSSFLCLPSTLLSVLGTYCEHEWSQLCSFRSHNAAKGLVNFSIKVYVSARSLSSQTYSSTV